MAYYFIYIGDNIMTLKFGSLFSGIGGFEIGFENAGMKCSWQVEIDNHASDILEQHWPLVRRYKDVREVGKHNLESVDVICGGFPCQDVSLAGQRAGLEGKRSTLWGEFFRIICEIKPGWVVAENVRGLFSSDNGQFFGNILRDLASIGYDAEWDCLPAAFFGAPQLRHRVYIVAYPQSNIRGSTRFFNIQSKDESDMEKHRGSSGQGIWNGIQIDRKRESSYIECFPQPLFLRVGDGISGELDKKEAAQRMKRCGNAVVPQAAEWIGKRIMEITHD
jgi:DNA (cytosine-5)-methyltransferase 1